MEERRDGIVSETQPFNDPDSSARLSTNAVASCTQIPNPKKNHIARKHIVWNALYAWAVIIRHVMC